MFNLKKLIKIGGIKFEKPNVVDRILEKLFLWAFPGFVKPNHLTIFRYLMTPIVFFLLIDKSYALGLVLFAITVFTDALDGAMARTRNQITNWGKLHDPLAGKILIGSAGAVLITRYIGVEIITIILLLEFSTVIAAIHLYDDEKREIGARLPGKIKMVCQSFGVGTLLLYSIYQSGIALGFAHAFFYLAIIFSASNIILYRAL